jgi:hypothetical protein
MLMLRRPLLWLFFLGSLVSLLASGRLSVRLIADGAVSFAFVPLFGIAALAVVWRREPRPALAFARTVDAFLAGLTPWLLWMIAAGGVFACVPPRGFGAWFFPVVISAVVPLVWSIWLDWRFFRDTLRRSPRRAIGDLVIHRAIAWTGAVIYFLGIAIWADALPGLAAKLGF